MFVKIFFLMCSSRKPEKDVNVEPTYHEEKEQSEIGEEERKRAN